MSRNCALRVGHTAEGCNAMYTFVYRTQNPDWLSGQCKSLFAAGVMNRIWHSTFNALWQLLLDLLGHDRGLTSILGVTPRSLRVRIGRCIISLW